MLVTIIFSFPRMFSYLSRTNFTILITSPSSSAGTSSLTESLISSFVKVFSMFIEYGMYIKMIVIAVCCSLFNVVLKLFQSIPWWPVHAFVEIIYTRIAPIMFLSHLLHFHIFIVEGNASGETEIIPVPKTIINTSKYS